MARHTGSAMTSAAAPRLMRLERERRGLGVAATGEQFYK